MKSLTALHMWMISAFMILIIISHGQISIFQSNILWICNVGRSLPYHKVVFFSDNIYNKM